MLFEPLRTLLFTLCQCVYGNYQSTDGLELEVVLAVSQRYPDKGRC